MRVIVSAQDMRANEGVASDTPKELMLKAARALKRYAKGRNIIVTGGGNNGGDGYALGWLLQKEKKDVCIFPVIEPKSDLAIFYRDLYRKAGGKESAFSLWDSLTQQDTIFDCLFGIGLKQAPKDGAAAVIEKINACQAFVVAADIASGLDPDSGIAFHDCVKADLTLCFGAVKKGCLLSDGKDFSGEIRVESLGIPLESFSGTQKDMEDYVAFFPRRLHNTNKGSYGKTLLIGGSRRYVGAPLLADHAATAARLGVGLSTLAIPKSIYEAVAKRTMCNTLAVCGEENLVLDEELKNNICSADSVALGMGTGIFKELGDIIEFCLNHAKKLLLDADALNYLSQNIDLLNKPRSAQLILTPHPKEMARLINKEVSDILLDSVLTAQSFANRYSLTLLLKGTTTVLSEGENIRFVSAGSPAMAKGGSGDVLSGAIAALMAQGLSPIDAGECGAYVCARAGEEAAAAFTQVSAVATDTIFYIPLIIKQIIHCK